MKNKYLNGQIIKDEDKYIFKKIYELTSILQKIDKHPTKIEPLFDFLNKIYEEGFSDGANSQ